jgi:peptidoglycan/LPS O-acetylase OafA/YrhL
MPPMTEGIEIQSNSPEIPPVDHRGARIADATITPRGDTSRIGELDGLRGLAAMLVLIHHFAALLVRRFPTGAVGVRIFFVLSGYLITGIILDGRTATDTGRQTPGAILRRFYLRRILRLVPVLYLTVAFCVLFNLGPARQSWPWDLTYLSNFFGIRMHDTLPAVGHFWTLAIEEQFYLVWPFLLLFTPRRMLREVILIAIIAAPISRLIDYAAGLHWIYAQCFPLVAFDALGLGALLILDERENDGITAGMLRKIRLALYIGVPIAVTGLLVQQIRLPDLANTSHWRWAVEPLKFFRRVIVDSSLALVGFGIIGLLRRFPKSLPAAILRTGPMVYLGLISYGMYVYHIPIKAYFDQYLAPRYVSLPREGTLGYFFLLTAITLVVASISWFAMEKPIAAWKKRWARTKLLHQPRIQPDDNPLIPGEHRPTNV